MNPVYYRASIVSGIWEAAHGHGETAVYPGAMGKLTIALALIRGDCQALLLLPRMLRKRREIERIRKLSPRQVRDLILENGISLRELSGHYIALRHQVLHLPCLRRPGECCESD